MSFNKLVLGFFSLLLYVFSSGLYAANWQTLNDGMSSSASINQLAINPGNSDELYAAARFSGLFKSVDHGKSWQVVAPAIFGSTFIERVIYAPVSYEVYVVTDQGLFSSADQGQTWQLVTNISDLRSLIINPRNANEMYLLDWSTDLYKTVDHGKTWQKLVVPTKKFKIDDFEGLSIHPQDSNILYLTAIKDDFDNSIILKSLDGGKTWQFFSAINFFCDQIQFSSKNLNVLYLGGVSENNDAFLSQSTDGGITWKRLLQGKGGFDSFYVNPKNSNEIFVNFEDQGIFRSQDAGKSWLPVPKVHASDVIKAIQFNSNWSKEFYVSSDDNGLSQTKDGGVTWQAVNNGLFSLNATTIVANPVNPQIKYAGTAGNGLWVTYDNKTWSQLKTPFKKGSIQKIIINRINPDILVVLYVNSRDEFGVYQSQDAGKTWKVTKQSQPNDEMYVVVENPANPNEIYLFYSCYGTNPDSIILKSNDSGATWSEYARIPMTSFSAGPHPIFFINPYNPQEFFSYGEKFFGRQYIMKSSDAGHTWVPMADEFDWGDYPTAMAFDRNNPNLIYVSMEFENQEEAHLYKSTDGGMHLIPMSGKGLPSYPAIEKFEIDPNHPNRMYAAVNDLFASSFIGKGVFMSNDNGESWSSLNDGLYDPLVSDILLSDGKLYAATNGWGVFVTDAMN